MATDTPINNLRVDSSNAISKDDLLALISQGIKSNEGWAKGFQTTVIDPLFRKIGRNIDVSKIELGTDLRDSINNKLTKEVEEVADQAVAGITAAFKEFGVQVSEKLNKSTDDLSELKIFKILDIPELDILKKEHTRVTKSLTDALKRVNVDKDTFSVSDILIGKLPPPLEAARDKLKTDTLGKTYESLRGVSKFLVDSSSGATGSGAMPPPLPTGKKDLLERNPEFTISDISPAAAEQLATAFSKMPVNANVTGGRATEKSPDNESWVIRLAKIAGALGVGAIALAINAFNDDGPFKGFKQLVSKLMAESSVFLFKKISTGLAKLVKLGIADPIVKLFDDAIKFVGKFSKTAAGGLAKKVAGGKGFFALIAKKIGGVMAKVAKGARWIPGIGAIMSFAFAVGKLKKGDWVGALLEIASGIAWSVPGVGTALGIGIDVLIAFRDFKKSKEPEVKGDQASSGFFDKMKTAVSGFISKHLYDLPVIGRMFKIADSFKELMAGNIKKGLGGIIGNLVMMIGGGAYDAVKLAIGIFSEESDTEPVDDKGDGSIWSKMKTAVGSFLSSKVWSMPIFGRLLKIGKSIGDVFAGKIVPGFVSILGNMVKLIPGGGIVVSAAEKIMGWLSNSEEDTTGEVQPQNVSIWQQMKTLAHKKLRAGIINLYSKSPKWVKWVIDKIPFLSTVIRSTQEEQETEGDPATPDYSADETTLKTRMREWFKTKAVSMYNSAPKWLKFMMNRIPFFKNIVKSGDEVVSSESAAGDPVVNVVGVSKDVAVQFKAKMVKIYNTGSKWMQWLMRRTPIFDGLFGKSSADDTKVDAVRESTETTDKDLADIMARVQKAKLIKMFNDAPAWMQTMLSLDPVLSKELGIAAQIKPTAVQIKDSNQSMRVVAADAGARQGAGVQALREEIRMLGEQLQSLQQAQAPVSVPNVAMEGASLDIDKDIRDPAFKLRSEWRSIATGSRVRV